MLPLFREFLRIDGGQMQSVCASNARHRPIAFSPYFFVVFFAFAFVVVFFAVVFLAVVFAGIIVLPII